MKIIIFNYEYYYNQQNTRYHHSHYYYYYHCYRYYDYHYKLIMTGSFMNIFYIDRDVTMCEIDNT